MTPTNSNPSTAWLARAYRMADLQADGWTYKQIADHFDVAVQTVGWSLTRLRTLDPTVPKKAGSRAAKAAHWEARRQQGHSIAAIAADEHLTPNIICATITRHRREHNRKLLSQQLRVNQ